METSVLSETSPKERAFLFFWLSLLSCIISCVFRAILQQKSYGRVMISSSLYLYYWQWFLSTLPLIPAVLLVSRPSPILHFLHYLAFWRLIQSESVHAFPHLPRKIMAVQFRLRAITCDHPFKGRYCWGRGHVQRGAWWMEAVMEAGPL